MRVCLDAKLGEHVFASLRDVLVTAERGERVGDAIWANTSSLNKYILSGQVKVNGACSPCCEAIANATRANALALNINLGIGKAYVGRRADV